ncbi:MAG: O-antigen ligase family protein [Bryobacteraceae bacterium]
MLVFLLGALVPIPIELVGVMYAGELLLMIVAAWATIANLQNPRFWNRAVLLPLAGLGLTFLGYILSDLINNSGLSNLMRGWARIVFLAGDILAIYFLCRKKPVNLPIFCLGIAAGVAGAAETQSGQDLFFRYKLAIALPITLAVLCLGALLRGRMQYLLISLSLAAVGVLHIWMDFRSLGAICLLTGAIVFSKTLERSRVRGLHAVLLLGAVAAGAGILSYSYYSTQNSYSHRRRESDNWRLASGTAALDAIRRAPLLGSGSWATSSQILTVFDASFAESAGRRLTGRAGMELAGHSQVLQVWYEAGLLGLAFFLYFAATLLRALWISIFRAPLDPVMPLAILSCLLSLYNLGFSPFAGTHRIQIAISIAAAEIVRRNWRSFANARNLSWSTPQLSGNRAPA